MREASIASAFTRGSWRSRIRHSRTRSPSARKQNESYANSREPSEQSPASVVITAPDGRIEYVNPKFEEVTGYTLSEVTGKSLRLLKSGYASNEQSRELYDTVLAGREWRGEFHNRKKNGDLFWEYASVSPIFGENGEITHILSVNEDITVRKEYEEKLLHQANFDHLTGLPNRILALDRLSRAILQNRRKDALVVVMFIDLDNFKIINDTLGHSAGDQLLKTAAWRLQDAPSRQRHDRPFRRR